VCLTDLIGQNKVVRDAANGFLNDARCMVRSFRDCERILKPQMQDCRIGKENCRSLSKLLLTLNNAKHPSSLGVTKGTPRPRPALFEVRKPNEDENSSSYGKWRIVGFVHGLRKQFWFKSEKDAKQAAKVTLLTNSEFSRKRLKKEPEGWCTANRSVR
jgi:hypothetical protein